MNIIVRFLLLLPLAGVGTAAAARKSGPLNPARPTAEAAAAFYPEIQKHADFYQRWAGTATGAELDTCRAHYRRAILDAFGAFAVARRREFAQTRWTQKYAVRCKGKAGAARHCQQTFSAPLGQEYDPVGLSFSARGFSSVPLPSPDRRRLTVDLTKKGSGVLVARVTAKTRRTVEDMERELARELKSIREKLERHGLPSDNTLEKYMP